MIGKEFAKAILCKAKSKPCNNCEACISFNGNNNPDMVVIDDEKSIKTEMIKQMIKETNEKPIKSERKVYIINNAEKMTKEAQNSLLKTLEEPPEYAVIILITQNENLLLNTIKSRCTKIKFNSLDNEDVKKILKEKYNYENVSDTILEIAQGSINRALNAIENEDILIQIKNMILSLENISKINFLNKKDLILKDKEKINEILNYLNVFIYKKAIVNNKYINCIKKVEETKDRIKSNCNLDMSIDNLLLKLWEEING